MGSRLRIPQVTPADSGEYVCHVSNGVGSQETSLIVTIESRGPSHGENVVDKGGESEDPQYCHCHLTVFLPLPCFVPSAQCLPTNED